MGFQFELYWEGMSEEDEAQLPYVGLKSLQWVFIKTNDYDDIIEKFGNEVIDIQHLYNFEPDVYTIDRAPEAWREPTKLLELINRLLASAKRRDTVIKPLAAVYNHYDTHAAEGLAWEDLVDKLEHLRDALGKAVELGAGPVTFDGSVNIGPRLPRRK